jgi:hypothetical protein
LDVVSGDDGTSIFEVHMGELKEKGATWKPYNQNLLKWAFNKINNIQLIDPKSKPNYEIHHLP